MGAPVLDDMPHSQSYSQMRDNKNWTSLDLKMFSNNVENRLGVTVMNCNKTRLVEDCSNKNSKHFI